MRQIRTYWLLPFVFLIAGLAHAQHSLTIPAKTESAIRRSEPGWELAFVSIRKTNEENYSYFRWKHAGDEIAVHVNEYDSLIRITRESMATQAFRKTEQITGIGDEAFLLGPAHYGPKKFDIIFRKGKVRVDVEAPSEGLARQFAKHCARALPAR
jgi:hypothetical protein